MVSDGPHVTLRAARAEDARDIAEIWHLGWQDGHLGFIPARMERGLVNRDQKTARPCVQGEAVPGGSPQATGRALARVGDARAIVLVEGISDQNALETLAARRGRNLEAEGVSVVAMGGAQAIGRYLDLFGPRGHDVRLAGLCDAAEEGDFRRGLERAGLGSNLTRAGMEELGFYVCVEDLEDELVRSVGAAAVEQIIAAEGELGSFHTFQKQPAKRELTYEEQLWRFMWNRKARYATLLVQSLNLTRVPRPLDGVLARV